MHQALRVVDERGTVKDSRLKHGDPGSFQALAPARDFIINASQDEVIRALALRIVARVKGHDAEAELDALYTFCRDQIKYRKDPRGQERVQSARLTLKTRAGDCLDKVILFCALAGSLGYVTRFALLQVRQYRTPAYDHVFAEARLFEKWKAYDPTPELGWAGWSGKGIRRTAVSIYTPAEQLELAGFLSVLGKIATVGTAFIPGAGPFISAGVGMATGALDAKAAKGKAEKEAGATFDQQAGALAAHFRELSSKPTLTPQEYSDAAQRFAQLEQFAQAASAVKFIAQKWQSDAYAPSFRRQLEAMRGRVVSTSPGAPASPGAPGSNASLSPLWLVGGGLAALYVFSR